MKRIAICSSTFPLYYLTFIIDFIELLSKKHKIDLFLHNSGKKLPQFNKNVKIIVNEQNQIKKHIKHNQLFNQKMILTLKKFSKRNYHMIIGIESLGLLMANHLYKNQMLIYYSFELYTKNHKGILGQNFKMIKKTEANIFNNKLSTLIIQDKQRKQVLKKSLNITKNINTIYLPVSLKNRPFDFIKKTDDINIMYYGQLSPYRFNTHMVEAAQDFKDNIKLILNAVSFGGNDYINKLKALDKKDKVIFDLIALENEQVTQNIIDKASIGLVFYRNNSLNEKLTGVSSVKLAHYMQANVPIICFSNTSISNIVNKYNNGIAINNFNQLNDAIIKILDNYNFYKKNTIRAYKEIYCLDNHVKKYIR